MASNLIEQSATTIEDYHQMLLNNRKFVEGKLKINPDFFNKLSKGQTPKYLLIGCADSRAPPNELTGTEPGEIFIHRNIANCVIPTDLSVNCILQYALEHLKIRNIIVMGHTFCGGVKAAMGNDSVGGMLDLWLNNIKLTYEKYQPLISELENEDDKLTSLCCMHVREQVQNLWKNPIIQKAWNSGIPIIIHGWLLRVESGLIEELCIDETVPEEMSRIFKYKFNAEEKELKPQVPQRHDKFSRMQTQIINKWRASSKEFHDYQQDEEDQVEEK